MPTDFRTYTGSELRAARERLGASVNDVAAELGRSRWTVWRMERAEAQHPWLYAKRYFTALDAIARRAA